MKLLASLELGRDCGLYDVRSALENIDIHASNIFPHKELVYELTELTADSTYLFDMGGSLGMSIVDAIELMRS